MKLQLALDIFDVEKSMEIADQVHDIADIIEVGTPIMMTEGLTLVKMIKEKYPDVTVLADTKIIDGGGKESRAVCEGGADIVTVLGLADDETITDVVETVHGLGKLVVGDMLCVEDLPKRQKELMELGVDMVAVHTGVDRQKRGITPLMDLKILREASSDATISVAGGINLDTIDDYVAAKADVIIVGNAICQAENIRETALQMKAKLKP